MKTKQEKIKAWLIEQVEQYPSGIEGVLTKHGLVPIPWEVTRDDQPEPKDKALRGYLLGCTDREYSLMAVLIEINARLKALEAANEKA